MQSDEVTAILKEFDKQRESFSAFTEKVKKLIMEILEENDLHVHSVTSRIKARDSLEAKLAQSEGEFSKLDDVTDISGIRIITYFADDVDSVASVIQKEFEVDKAHSVDKRELLDPDRFGYLSLHYVVKLLPSRQNLTEYRRFKDCRAEIQVRSILQHAWAEIEHDLGYKGKHVVPRETRRRFSRLAGILEMVDEQFIQIRNDLKRFDKRTRAERIAETPTLVSIDETSLQSYIEDSPLVDEVDNAITSEGKKQIVKSGRFFLIQLAGQLSHLGFKTIADIDSSLRENKGIVIDFTKLWIKGKPRMYNAGICLFYLCYVLLGVEKSVKKVYDYLEAFGIGDPRQRRLTAEEVITTYTRVVSSKT